MCTPSTYQSSITLPSMLSHEDEKLSVRRVCKNVSVRTLTVVAIICSPSREGRDGTSHRQGRSLLRGWMGSIYWRTLRTDVWMFVLQAHISHPLPCLKYKTMLSHEDEKQSVRSVCKNVSVRTLSLSFACSN